MGKDLTATAELWLGSEQLTIKDNKFTFKKTGDYTLVYRSTDKSNNTAVLEHTFTVVAKPQQPTTAKKGCGSALASGSAITIGMAVCAVAILKKAKRNK